jgi:hypothetical protein
VDGVVETCSIERSRTNSIAVKVGTLSCKKIMTRQVNNNYNCETTSRNCAPARSHQLRIPSPDIEEHLNGLPSSQNELECIRAINENYHDLHQHSMEIKSTVNNNSRHSAKKKTKRTCRFNFNKEDKFVMGLYLCSNVCATLFGKKAHQMQVTILCCVVQWSVLVLFMALRWHQEFIGSVLGMGHKIPRAYSPDPAKTTDHPFVVKFSKSYPMLNLLWYKQTNKNLQIHTFTLTSALQSIAKYRTTSI